MSVLGGYFSFFGPLTIDYRYCCYLEEGPCHRRVWCAFQLFSLIPPSVSPGIHPTPPHPTPLTLVPLSFSHYPTRQCFGYNKNGELGLGDTSSRGDGSTNGAMGDDLGTVNLGTGVAATAVSSGWQHTCALLEGGAVKCWGKMDFRDEISLHAFCMLRICVFCGARGGARGGGVGWSPVRERGS